jgi:hypothetical protein
MQAEQEFALVAAAADVLAALGIDLDREERQATRPGWPAPTRSCLPPARSGLPPSPTT